VFEIAIQTGAIFAVILVYMQRIKDTISGLGSDPKAQRFALNVVVGFVPAVVIGLAVGKAVKAHLFNAPVVATTFIAGGIIILIAERFAANRPAPRVATVDDMTLMDAIKVGFIQCLALIPGTSRSGSTIIGGMLLGLSRKAATDFSFFLGIPTLVGAGAYSLYKERALLSAADLPLFSVGLVFAFLSAWVCVRWLIKYVSSHNFNPFAWYRIAFGILILVSWQMNWVTWAE
jgi:undecaprenyl-diphosphatase